MVRSMRSWFPCSLFRINTFNYDRVRVKLAHEIVAVVKCWRTAIIASRRLIMEFFSILWLDLCVRGFLVLFLAFQRLNTFKYDRVRVKLAHEIAVVVKCWRLAIIISVESSNWPYIITESFSPWFIFLLVVCFAQFSTHLFERMGGELGLKRCKIRTHKCNYDHVLTHYSKAQTGLTLSRISPIGHFESGSC